MMIKYKKILPEAQIFTPAYPGDAGFDIAAAQHYTIDDNGVVTYRTGIILEIPEGYYVDIRPRSSIFKKHLILCNAPGTIDSQFRGEVMIKFRLTIPMSEYNDAPHMCELYAVGDRIAQLVVQEKIDATFVAADEVTESVRGSNGFGSSGN